MKPIVTEGLMNFPLPSETSFEVLESLFIPILLSTRRPARARWLNQHPSARFPKFEQIMRGANQRPFAFYFPQSSQKKLSESSALLDLAEHRLHRFLPFRIIFSSLFGSEFPPHLIDHRQILGNGTARCIGNILSVFLSVRRNQRFDSHRFDVVHVVFTEIACVQAGLIRILPCIFFHLLKHGHGLFLIFFFLSHIFGHNYLVFIIYGRLAVISLVKTPLVSRGWHNPALGIGEISLRFGGGHGVRFLGRATTVRFLRFDLGFLLLGFFSSLSLPRLFGLLHLFQAALPERQLRWQFIPAFVLPVFGVFPLVCIVGLLQQSFHFLFQSLFFFFHPVVAHGLMLRGIGFDFGPIHRHVSQFHQSRFLAQLQNLHEPFFQTFQVILPAIRNGSEIRLLIPRQNSKRHIFLRSSGHLSTRENTAAISIEKKTRLNSNHTSIS